jgi:hypothetical protein
MQLFNQEQKEHENKVDIFDKILALWMYCDDSLEELFHNEYHYARKQDCVDSI